MRSRNSEPGAEDPNDPVVLRAEVDQLRAENARLQRLLELRQDEARPPGPTQTGIFDSAPGAVHNGSSPEKKIAFFRALFAARADVYAVRWENSRTGRSGCMPAIRGGWRKGADRRDYLLLTEDVVKGCGSFGGTSGSDRNSPVGVASLMDSVSFLCEVERPVVVEVTVAA